MSLDDVTDLFDGNMNKMEEIFTILARAMTDDNSKSGKKQTKKVRKS